jgi:BirA family biotin operon repressor/biotin-[acetyl-CoA-carboxylase] ligase
VNWRLRRYASLPSTSDLCVQLARGGEPDGLAVLAERQTAARGSRGRTWESLPGALCLSVLLRPRDPPAASGHWALLAALALHGALAPHAPAGSLGLKWPNDVLIGDCTLAKRKVGGILLDAATGEAGLDWLVIGFGANLAAAPDGAGALAAAPGPGGVAAAVLDQLDHWRRIRLVDGWAPIRAAWLALAHPAGTPLRIRTGGHDFGGAFDGLAEDGALLLRADGRVRAFATGDVLLDREG